MKLIGAHGGEVMYFRGELDFMDCDDISMCCCCLSFSPCSFPSRSLTSSVAFLYFSTIVGSTDFFDV